MKLRLLLITVLLAASAEARAQKGEPTSPPESLVKACLATCQAESARCSRDAREAGKQPASKSARGRLKPRSPGLRWCGCAYVGCKLSCRRHAQGSFFCGGGSMLRAPFVAKGADNSCKKDRDCALMPKSAPCR